MPSIGGYEFLTLTGELNTGTGHQLEEITRPGVDGVAYRRLGRRGLPFQMQSVADVATAAEAQSLIYAYKDLQGQVVTLVDAAGNTWTNVAVLRVIPAQPRFAAAMAGGLSGASSGWLVRCVWLLQMTEYF